MRKMTLLRAGSLFLALVLLSVLLAEAAAGESSNSNNNQDSKQHQSKSSSSTATQNRQSAGSAAASLIGAIGSLVPSLITNVAPLVLLFGIGALMMPALGMGLLREARRSASDQLLPNVQLPFPGFAMPAKSTQQDLYYLTKRSFPSMFSGINSQSVMKGLQQVLERVQKAIENADQQFA